MVFDWDDFGVNHVISDMCQSHDCRDKLDELHYLNPNFKATLFAIPAEITYELAEWCSANKGWIELAIHGFKHTSNYECVDWTKEECLKAIDDTEEMFPSLFVKGFKAPGWQISDACYEALLERGFWISDQGYNDHRRPLELKAYVNYDGVFRAGEKTIPAWHGHTWNCSGNGIEETIDKVKDLVKNAESFEFISEVVA